MEALSITRVAMPTILRVDATALAMAAVPPLRQVLWSGLQLRQQLRRLIPMRRVFTITPYFNLPGTLKVFQYKL